ncbi:Mannosylfructose-phosphate phosphatase [Roseivivax sp. THAF40]|uniref:HAD family hydrolase n=1 Tax=unclassified Roseivivax TaxID=2639302 RepID=UPI001268C35E|nr:MULTISPECIES: HAD family hydrolase [unclassified Roseivivax]QFS83000.1 Mannosylfructose-phosphate phosphatase [Roseivivax sp. THAF197b]QFT46771.1 Mannosylfructose-phosphate phosphatase [Roseivivax sp. THAF40]
MTQPPPISTALHERRFVLATDLDGTFLGGSDADRKRLYDWIEAHRETIGLVFVTGRDPAFIRTLCDSGVPWPEYVIGDVGTTIAKVVDKDITPIAELEEEIASLWNDGGPAVRAALEGHPGLILQPTSFRYRVSYDLQPSDFDDSAKTLVTDLGHDWLISDNKYFDVLPRGVSKGPSLRRFVAHMNIPEKRVLAAGDTLNDASMLECGLPAVAVGGSEAALLDRVGHLDHVHKATAIGAGGILEAVGAMDLHPVPEGV